jgi:hypothetical protein
MGNSSRHLVELCRNADQAESGGTVFDRGAEIGAPGANAFDGVNVLNGAELMTETGSLRFVVGLKALASGYDANGNVILRLKDGARYFLSYDAKSRAAVGFRAGLF